MIRCGFAMIFGDGLQLPGGGRLPTAWADPINLIE